MTIINSLKDLVYTTIRKVLVTDILVIIDFMFLWLMRPLEIAMNIYTSQSHHVKQYILTTTKIKNILPKKLPQIDLLIGNNAKKNLLVTVILGDSVVKEVKGWELLDENNKFVTKQFSGATTDDMKSYI